MLLKELFDFLPKSRRSASYGFPEGKYPFFTSSNIIDKYVDEPDYKGEFLIIGDGGTGNCKFYNGSFSASDHNYLLRPKSKTNTQCVQYFLQRNNFKILNEGFKGVGIKNVSKTYIENIDYIYNHKFTENEIVSNLERIELAIENDKKQLALLDELIKSRFIEMFGDPVENPKNWNKRSLLDMGTCKNGLNYRPGETGVSVYCLGVGDFKDLSVINDVSKLSKIELEKTPSEVCMLKDGDIVFVRSNGNKALVGRCLAVYPQTAQVVHGGFCIRYRRNYKDLDTAYLLSVLKSDSMRMKMAGHGANIQNLNQKILASLDIPIPPLSLQNEFAEFVKLIDKSKFVVHSRYFLCDILTLFSSTIA